MCIVSDFIKGSYRITGMFSGPDALKRAKRWAGANGKITRLRSKEIWKALDMGMALPARYTK